MATWPTTLPQQCQDDGLNIAPGKNLIRTEMDTGRTKSRTRYTAVPDYGGFSFILTAAQYATFLTFYKDTIDYGATPYTWLHPLTDVAVNVCLTEVPKAAPMANGYFSLELSAEMWPV